MQKTFYSVMLCATMLFCMTSMGISTTVYAATKYIAIVNSNQNAAEKELTQRIKKNAQDLLRGTDQLVFKQLNGQNNASKIKRHINRLQADKRTNLIITTGVLASEQLALLKRFNKPSIATHIIDEELQNLTLPLLGRSGIKNFTYIKSESSMLMDLQRFHQLYPFKKLGIVADASLKLHTKNAQSLFKKYTSKPFTVISVSPKTYKAQIQKYKNQVDALYVLPLSTFSNKQKKLFYGAVSAQKLATFAMNNPQDMQLGALSSIYHHDNQEVRARRTALNIIKLLTGKPAASLPVTLPRLPTEFVINMKTAKDIDLYPSFSVLQHAKIINPLSPSEHAQKMTVFTALKIALAENLSLKKAKKEIELADNQIKEANRAFLPTLDVSYIGTKVDKDFRKTQGAGITQKIKASATQVLYSDQALALRKARKLGMSANLEALKRTEYEVVYNVLSGYVQHFNAKRQVQLQLQNTERTRQNLAVAKQKANVGYASNIDVHRLEAELANNQASLSRAKAQFKQTAMALKTILNLPLKKDITFIDIDNPINLLSIGNKGLFQDLNNQKKVDTFTDYLLHIAMQTRPAVLQYAYNIQAQKKVANATKRSWYIPTVSVSANLNKEISRHDKVPGHSNPTMQPKWDINLIASIPLFDRQQKTDDIRNALNIEKLEIARDDIVKNINLGLRNDMHTAMSSYQQMQLYKTAAISAQKTQDMMIKSYQYGRTDIVSLINAQNSALNSRINAINAEQQFFIDFLKVEKQSGFYYFLATAKARQEFLDGFIRFAQEKNTDTPQKTTVTHIAHTQKTAGALKTPSAIKQKSNTEAITTHHTYRVEPLIVVPAQPKVAELSNPNMKKSNPNLSTDNF